MRLSPLPYSRNYTSYFLLSSRQSLFADQAGLHCQRSCINWESYFIQMFVSGSGFAGAKALTFKLQSFCLLFRKENLWKHFTSSKILYGRVRGDDQQELFPPLEPFDLVRR